MRRIIVTIFILTCLAILIHDAGSGRFRTFRNLQDDRYVPLLFEAVEKGDLAAVHRLTRMTGNINPISDTRRGFTLLHSAAESGHKVMVEFLIANGVEVNVRDDHGATPLHYASGGGYSGVAGLLMSKGVDVNAKTHGGVTPIWRATGHGHKIVVGLLMLKGADLNDRNAIGQTPLDLAEYRGHKELVAFLRQHGGKTGKELDEEAENQRSEVRGQESEDKNQKTAF